ncbi:MAG: flavodoxin-dependent (E)-4-hydroxy-3-methylbut-2-enyl-diphosphate synthase [Firmicutes bacterium]|nr:flavodoxin-dependent (E)-4-hydroxy-3-methylbut-2-enyl-diphosphate synthase [Bacillota bacterium]
MSTAVQCGNVTIGGGAPVSIQSMTNVDTRDIKAVAMQINDLASEGCQIVRVAVPDMESAEALKTIKQMSPVPIVADIHFDHRLAIKAIQMGADKIRINPGNIGSRDKVREVVEAAKERNIPIRVGVNSGSLEEDILKKYGGVTAEGLVESALNNLHLIEDMGYDNLVVSLKSSDVQMNYDAHVLIAQKTDHPIHIGITEAGTVHRGKIKSAAGIGALLLAGIGDTMRVSLTADPVTEVVFAKELLKAIGLRKESINLVSCPTCGRTKVNLQDIALQIQKALEPIEKERTAQNKKGITVAVMGCAVNGPGEGREADIGVACGDGKGIIFVKGETVKTVSEQNIAMEMINMIKGLE